MCFSCECMLAVNCMMQNDVLISTSLLAVGKETLNLKLN